MGFRFRKSFGKGPFRVNISKRGVGWSVGTKGVRYTKKAGGGSRTTLSVPGTGLSYVSESSKRKKKVGEEYKVSHQPKGHSAILHLLFGGLALYIPTIYFMCSKNHYFHW